MGSVGRRVDSRGYRCIEDARPVDVYAEPTLLSHPVDRSVHIERDHRTSRAVVRVLQQDERGSWRVKVWRSDGRFNLGDIWHAPAAAELAGLDAGQRGGSAHLVAH